MKKIEMTPVQSSAVEAAGYDAQTGTMRVRMKGGAEYDYENVPLDRYAAFTGANSAGNYLNTRIKPNHQAKKVKP